MSPTLRFWTVHFDQPDHPTTLSGKGFQQLQHARVVDSFPDQRGSHIVGDVIVADRDRIGVTDGTRPDFSRGPRPDAPQHREPIDVALNINRRCPTNCPHTYRLRAAAMPFPTRNVGPCRTWRRHPQSFDDCRPGCRFTKRPHQVSPRPPRLRADNLLLENRRRQRLPHPVGPTNPEPPSASNHIVDDRIARRQ